MWSKWSIFFLYMFWRIFIILYIDVVYLDCDEVLIFVFENDKVIFCYSCLDWFDYKEILDLEFVMYRMLVKGNILVEYCFKGFIILNKLRFFFNIVVGCCLCYFFGICIFDFCNFYFGIIGLWILENLNFLCKRVRRYEMNEYIGYLKL